jgi:ankyrin repeat protein
MMRDIIFAEEGSLEARLLAAAKAGNEAEVVALLASGANVHGLDPETKATAWILATEGGHASVAARLTAAGATVNAVCLDGSSREAQLLRAAKEGDEIKVAALLAAGANVHAVDSINEETALLLAVVGGYSRVVAQLIAAGSNVHTTSRLGSCALILAGQSDSDDNLNIMDQLLTAGAKVNATNGLGNTALMYAAQGRPNLVALLLDAEANADAKGENEATALMWAARSRNPVTFSQLQKAGADVNAVDSRGRTVMNYVDLNWSSTDPAVIGIQQIAAASVDTSNLEAGGAVFGGEPGLPTALNAVAAAAVWRRWPAVSLWAEAERRRCEPVALSPSAAAAPPASGTRT